MISWLLIISQVWSESHCDTDELLAGGSPAAPDRLQIRPESARRVQFGDDPFLFQHDCTPVNKARSGRHADAIFTNSYRKVLGQISARKFLQTITGKGSG
ncbi:hypothetical protein QTP70_022638 [Hemibagrus guttatus]|uniref:Somatoliberin n=1 Tax=Hemibagrus guttatus TaxID=175788 RepID=A0AAE0UME2_9TELE|nr:hypothetical protein QTP70_022638 [Hemibagrus guttatus]